MALTARQAHNAQRRAAKALADEGLTLADARRMTDEQLLAIENIGPALLAFIRTGDIPRCPCCGRPTAEK